jgi:putative oxygen-independent coproporphyrinogen III oxidase
MPCSRIFTWTSCRSRHQVSEAEETGLTFVENAILKARNAAHCIRDCRPSPTIPAGGGRAGRRARHLFGPLRRPGASDRANLDQLLLDLIDVPRPNAPRAFNVCWSICATRPIRTPLICQGTWEGMHPIRTARRQRLRLRPGVLCADARLLLGRVAARAVKNALSHRGQALRPTGRGAGPGSRAAGGSGDAHVPMLRLTIADSLALYVHIPWCVRKCPYCDFNSHEARAVNTRTRLRRRLAGRSGAGITPGVGARGRQRLHRRRHAEPVLGRGAGSPARRNARPTCRCKPDLEITLEANPGTVEQGRFREFRAAGINRLSIGIQSFDDSMLERIGRIHGRREAIRAVELAHDAGFDSFNLDLMFGLPCQSPAQALTDLAMAMDLEPAHLSWYQLTLEPNTYFHRHPPQLPDDEALWEMQRQGQARLAARGYTQYEVSAYARAGMQCRHNLNYWQYGDYLGIGAGAHQKLTDANLQRIRRSWKLKNPRDYLATAHAAMRIGGASEPDASEVVLEFLMNALRLNAGFPTALFEQATGLDFERMRSALERARQRELLELDEPWRCTELGRRFLNDLLAEFVPDDGHA